MSALEPGRHVGPYVVEALIGMGGMGEVYRARDPRLGRLVALKVVRSDREDHSGVAPDDRLLAEARAAAALRHPNVVEIYDVGRDGGATYVAMEFIVGKPLRAFVGEPTIPLATRKRWAVEIGGALAVAHRIGLLHRDIKPDNVLIDEDGRARVLDFGLAKRLAFDAGAPTADAPAPETLEGRVVGTVSYMAPEQLAGAAPDPKWDQFAWAVLVYELFTGLHPRVTVPMPGTTAHHTQSPKMPNELAPEVPFADAAAIMRAMASDPSRRHTSMDAALAALRDDPADVVASRPKAPAWEPPTRRVSARWPALGAAVVAAAAGALVARQARCGKSESTARLPSAQPVELARTAPAPAPPARHSAEPARPAPSAAATSSGRLVAAHVARPEDYGSKCACFNQGSDMQQLCPLSSDVHERECHCAGNDIDLRDAHGSNLLVHGRDLRDGEPCTGFDPNLDASVTGHTSECEIDCNNVGFAGIHRTPCRGLDHVRGTPSRGWLSCF